jgi:cobalamin biosynthesis protein CobD/CbiB
MSNTYRKRQYAVGFLIALLACGSLFLIDWSRHPVGVFIDIVLMVVLAIAVMKALIDSPSESERQRRFSDPLNRQ